MQQEYGCDIYGQYEYPYNTMSQDWSGDQVEGFYYHEITEECKKAMTFWPRITTDSGEHRKIYGPMGCMSTNTTEPFWKGRRN